MSEPLKRQRKGTGRTAPMRFKERKFKNPLVNFMVVVNGVRNVYELPRSMASNAQGQLYSEFIFDQRDMEARRYDMHRRGVSLDEKYFMATKGEVAREEYNDTKGGWLPSEELQKNPVLFDQLSLYDVLFPEHGGARKPLLKNQAATLVHFVHPKHKTHETIAIVVTLI